MVQWLELSAFTAKGPGSIPGQGTKIPQALHGGQKKKKKKKKRRVAKQLQVMTCVYQGSGRK